MYVDDRLGRRSRARSGLDQLDFAEDLFAVVAAAVAVVVSRAVVHVLDHGRGADRRITINRVGRRRVSRNYFFQVVSETPRQITGRIGRRRKCGLVCYRPSIAEAQRLSGQGIRPHTMQLHVGYIMHTKVTRRLPATGKEMVVVILRRRRRCPA